MCQLLREPGGVGCRLGDSCPWNWDWGAAPRGGTPGSSSQDQALPEEPSQKTSSHSGSSGWTAPAQSSSSPPLGCFLDRRGSAQARASWVHGDDAGGLHWPPRHPLPSSPAGGTGSGSSGGWKNRDEDTSGRRLSDRRRLQDEAPGKGPPPSRGRSSRHPVKGGASDTHRRVLSSCLGRRRWSASTCGPGVKAAGMAHSLAQSGA